VTQRWSPGGQKKRRPSAPGSHAVVWSARALADLEAVGNYIARDSPKAAASWVGKVLTLAERAAAVPLAGRRVPELARDDIREVLLRNYRIVYRVAARRIEVLSVFEGHRLFPAAVGRRARRG
jgi:toxin ParE1/3/4